MKFRLQIDIDEWSSANTKVSNVSYTFNQIENIHSTVEINYDQLIIYWDSVNSYYIFQIYLNGESIGEYHGSDAVTYLGGLIWFDCVPSSGFFIDALKLEDKEYINMILEGATNILTYYLRDPRNTMNKNLLPSSYITGNFKAPLGIKNIELDITGYDISKFNYVYIPRLGRFYYVTNIQLVNKEYTRLILQEDVLMSHKSLIARQKAFITRSEEHGSLKIIDNRLPMESNKTITYITPNNTPSNLTKVNVTLKANFDKTNDYNIFISTLASAYNTPAKTNIISPDSDLPVISPVLSQFYSNQFVSWEKLSLFLTAVKNQSNFATFVNTILFLPFDPITAFNANTGLTHWLPIGFNMDLLWDDGTFNQVPHSPANPVTVYRTGYGTSPYLVIADFTFPDISNEWYNLDPYCTYEIYIPFVGWVKVDSQQVSNKRLLIYYSLEMTTGNATAYLYNKTNGKIIYSCSCQLGIKLDILATNALELSRERQSIELNTLIGLLASALSIGVGGVSQNPLAIAGGVLSAGKTIASAVNRERTMFDRAQVTYGSGDAGLHSNLSVVIRETRNNLILDSSEQAIYEHMQGLPSNVYDELSNYSNGYYIEIGEIHFDPKGSPIYSDEMTEIVQLLQNGIII